MSLKTIPNPKRRNWRAPLFRVVAGLASLLFLVMGGLHGLLAPWVRSWVASEPGIQHPQLHLWHDAQFGALMVILLVGSMVALLWQPREKPLLIQFLAVGSLIYLLNLALFDPASAIFLAIIFGLVIAAYPEPRALLRFSNEGPVSKLRLGLSLLTAALLAPDVWRSFRLQLVDVSEHALANHWITGAALAMLLVLAAILSAAGRSGRRTLGVLVGLALLHLGAAALTLPDNPGSWGITGGVISILGGLSFIFTTRWEAQRQPAPLILETSKVQTR